MQIVIPMSGFGERFRRAGYTVPKPLTPVDPDRTMIEHVAALFPGEADVTFICNRDHLETPEYRMAEILARACPSARVLSVPPAKLGPIHAVEQVLGDLDLARPTVVNYCDFAQFWDWTDFRARMETTGCDGAIPAYRGFHPHSLGSTFYAYLKLDETGERVVDIQEKQPWTETPMQEFASSGTYYFRTGDLMAHYFAECRRQDLMVNGEYYVSMAYRPMAYDGLDIRPYDLEHFMQWGTPGDLEEYQTWDRLFRRYDAHGLPPRHGAEVPGTLVIPMAGAGSRFVREGFADPKPLIAVDDRMMVVRALDDMPMAARRRIVTRSDLPQNAAITAALTAARPDVEIVSMDGLSEGQAISCLEGLDGLDDAALEAPLTIAACDNGVVFEADTLRREMGAADCLVWGYAGHAAARVKPESYSWIEAAADGTVSRVGVKEPVGDLATTPIVIGAFTFRTARLYRDAVRRMVDADDRTNDEFYADGVVNHVLAMGGTARLMPVAHFVSFGTPDEWRTYGYWQRCFSRWRLHPLVDWHRPEADGRGPEADGQGPEADGQGPGDA